MTSLLSSKAMISQSRTWEASIANIPKWIREGCFFHSLPHVSLLICVEGGEDGLRGIACGRFIRRCAPCTVLTNTFSEAREIEGTVGEKIDVHHSRLTEDKRSRWMSYRRRASLHLGKYNWMVEINSRGRSWASPLTSFLFTVFVFPKLEPTMSVYHWRGTLGVQFNEEKWKDKNTR